MRREGRLFLFDCGEGTQFQLLRGGLGRSHLDAVFITHLHGDHVYGLPGLLTTLALNERTEPLAVVGPPGLEAMLRAIPGLASGDPPYRIDIREWPEGLDHETVYANDALTIEARPLEHRVACAGYRLTERTRPGSIDAEAARAAGITEPQHFGAIKRGETVTLADGTEITPDGLVGPPKPGAAFAYVLDTAPCDGGRALAHRAALVLHEATFTEEHAERAVATGHSTARGAAGVARDAGAQRLLLTHVSARYRDTAALVAEAQAVFPASDVAVELERYAVRAGG